MTDFEAQAAEVLSKHEARVVYYNADEGHIECHGCDWKAPSFTGFHAHQAAMLAPLIAEAQAVALEEAAVFLSKPGTVWHGDSGVSIDIGDRWLRRPKLTDWLRARAASLRGGA